MSSAKQKSSEEQVESRPESAADDHAWVIDSLVQFLSGPVWNKPIAVFIEKKSTIFEPDTEDYTPEHHLVHQEYRNLVDSLLGGFVEELHISPSQFQQAVSSGGPGQGVNLSRFQPGALLEQVWAASDFHAFARLMGLRNLELQLQALDAIRNRGNVPLALEVFAEEGGEMGGEERLLKHVLRRSMEEASIVEKMNKKFNRLSLADGLPPESENFNFEEELKNYAEKTAPSEDLSKPGPAAAVKPRGGAGGSGSSPGGSPRPSTGGSSSTPSPPLLTEEEIQKRKAYLCGQRDKLLKAKGRTSKLASAPAEQQTPSPGAVALPRSERESEEALQLRRALVNRLRAEVINKP